MDRRGKAGLIVLMIGVAVNGGVGGGNFRMTAYQGVEQLGRTNVDFDTEKANAVGKPIVLNLWGGSCPPCRADSRPSANATPTISPWSASMWVLSSAWARATARCSS